MQKIIDQLAESPKIFNFLRAILEFNFPAEKRAIKKYLQLQTGDRLIDIGCGTGEFAGFFPAESYTGIDTEAGYISYASKHYQGRFLVADGTQLPFQDNEFSHGLIVGVLHHMPDEVASAALREASRVIQPGGHLLVMEDVVNPTDSFLTKKLHAMDKGKNIRQADEYRTLIEKYFKINEDYRVVSGICPYQIFWLENN